MTPQDSGCAKRSLSLSLRRLIIALGDDVCGFRFFPSAGFPA
jgi:hypothetical protein